MFLRSNDKKKTVCPTQLVEHVFFLNTFVLVCINRILFSNSSDIKLNYVLNMIIFERYTINIQKPFIFAANFLEGSKLKKKVLWIFFRRNILTKCWRLLDRIKLNTTNVFNRISIQNVLYTEYVSCICMYSTEDFLDQQLGTPSPSLCFYV